jgi:hypothetical protein
MSHSTSGPLTTISSALDPRTVIVRCYGFENAIPSGLNTVQYEQRNAVGKDCFVVSYNIPELLRHGFDTPALSQPLHRVGHSL